MTRLIAAVAALFLAAACNRTEERPLEEAPAVEPAGSPDDAAGTNPFFVGRWAANESQCADPWVITPSRLETPAGVACEFGEERAGEGVIAVSAICTAEAPPAPYELRFSYAQSARALLISGGPFADVGLVRCEDRAEP